MVKKGTRRSFLSFPEQVGSVSLRAMTCLFKPSQIRGPMNTLSISYEDCLLCAIVPTTGQDEA